MKTAINLLMLLAVLVAGSVAAAQPAREKQSSARAQPLTYENVVSYFKSAHLRAAEVQKRCTVLFEGEWASTNIYHYCLIIVEKSDEDIQVTFYLTDAHEMNWITEFCDGPFFVQPETEKLFGLMQSRRDIHGERVGRFRVDYHHWQPRHAHIIVFSFTPALSAVTMQLGSAISR